MSTPQASPFRQHVPLVAILRGIHPHEVIAHLDALLGAGFGLVEIPTNSPDWADSVAMASKRAGTRALIGAGTVLEIADVDALKRAGGGLMVTPNTEPAVIRHAVAQGLYCAIGFATASEAFTALRAGAQALKVFPATSYGPGHVRALRAVLPVDVPVLAVGGITPANLCDYLAAGCIGAGLGGDLYRAGQSAGHTARQARAFVEAFRSTPQ